MQDRIVVWLSLFIYDSDTEYVEIHSSNNLRNHQQVHFISIMTDTNDNITTFKEFNSDLKSKHNKIYFTLMILNQTPDCSNCSNFQFRMTIIGVPIIGYKPQQNVCNIHVSDNLKSI